MINSAIDLFWNGETCNCKLLYFLQGVLPDRPDTKPRILLFDFKNPTHKVTELKIDGHILGFRPHGLSAWTEPNSGIVKLLTNLLIRHRNQ